MTSTARDYLLSLHRDQFAPLPADITETPGWTEDFLSAIRGYRDDQLDEEAQRAAKRFGLSATKDRFRFIWELWQNADDAGASTLRFVIRDGELEVTNTGRPLSSRDVYSMCFVASSQKEGAIAQKGQFGIKR